jgi:subtilisin family serine protease
VASSGTSFAAPLVAGAIARILQLNPTMTPAQIWAKLQIDSTKAPDTPDFDESSTYANDKLLYVPYLQ